MKLRTTRLGLLLLFTLLFGQEGYGQSGNQVVDQTSISSHEFLIYTNNDYISSSDDFPLIIYLHGATSIGTISDDANKVKLHHGPPKLIHTNQWETSMPFVVVSPHMNLIPGLDPFDHLWDVNEIKEIYDYVVANYRIDINRVYLTGISSGARGVWNFVQAFPNIITTVMPFSGTGNLSAACNMDHVPLWAFHGDHDTFVPYSGSNDMIHYGPVDLVDHINTVCSPTPDILAFLTPLESKRHDGWNEVYDMSSGFEIYDWMLDHDLSSSSNISPMANAGPADIEVVESEGPFVLNGWAHDSDGTINTILWTKESGPAATLSGENTLNLRITNPAAGSYVFRLTVTDDDAATGFDEIQFDVVTTPTGPVVDELILFTIDGTDTTDIGPLTDGYVIDYAVIGTESIHIRAEASGWSDPNSNSMYFSLNQNRYFSSMNDTDGEYVMAGFIFGGIYNNFDPPLGVNYLTATPIDGRWSGPTGTSRTIAVEITEDATLPVTFSSMSLKSKPDHILINWTTAYESNSSHYEVQKLNETQEYVTIGSVESKNNLTGGYYSFSDYSPRNGINIYRIKSVDFDSQTGFSRTKSIEFKNLFDFVIYPNPSSGNVNVEMSNLNEGPILVSVYDVIGNQVFLSSIDSPEEESLRYNIKLNRLPSGLYILRIHQGGVISKAKFVVR